MYKHWLSSQHLRAALRWLITHTLIILAGQHLKVQTDQAIICETRDLLVGGALTRVLHELLDALAQVQVPCKQILQAEQKRKYKLGR